MKDTGIITKFDGYNGIIKSNDIEYMFNKNNLLTSVKIGDRVSFNCEIYETIEIKKYIATFIEKI